MPLQIIRGKRQGAIRAVIYGTEGIGKSTLAAQIPDALIIDTEDGTGQIETARVLALDWRAIEHALKELIADQCGFRAVVIDTADWLEKALIEHVLRQAGKKSIEDFGYGKGYTIIQEHVVRLLALIDQLIVKGVHVVFVAHSKVTRTSPPDQTDGFDRYELKLTRQVAPLLKEWADLVLFCNYRVQIVEGSDGRLKAQGGKERIMYAVHSAAWDAKNRFGLPDEMPMQFDQIAHLFAGSAPRPDSSAIKPAKASVPVAAAPAAKVEAKPKPAVAAEPAPAWITNEQLARLEALNTTPDGAKKIEDALDYLNAIGLDDLNAAQADELIAEIEAAAAAPKVTFTPEVQAWLEENENTANAYLRHVKWLETAGTWRDLSPQQADSIVERFVKFKSAASSHVKTGRKAA